MSYQLVEEVLNHAPGEITSGERLVLVAIAERTMTRAPRPWSIDARTMHRYTGLRATGLKDALQRLAVRGLDVRVPLGISKKTDQPYYTVPGTAPTYRLPTFTVPDDCDCHLCTPKEDEATPSPSATSENEGEATASPSSGAEPSGGHSLGRRGHGPTQTGPQPRQAGATASPNPSVRRDGKRPAGAAAAKSAATHGTPNNLRKVRPWCGRCASPSNRVAIDLETGAITNQPCSVCTPTKVA